MKESQRGYLVNVGRYRPSYGLSLSHLFHHPIDTGSFVVHLRGGVKSEMGRRRSQMMELVAWWLAMP